MPSPGSSTANTQENTQFFQQLLEALKAPSSARNKQKIITLLKANPKQAAFLKQRMDKKIQEKQLLKQEQQEKQLLKQKQQEKQLLKQEQQEKQLLKQEQQEKQLLKQEQQEKQLLMQEQQEKQLLMQEQQEKQLLKQEQQKQLLKQEQQQRQMLLSEGMIGNRTMKSCQVLLNSSPSTTDMQRPTQQAWKQLLKILKSPPSTEQQQQVQDILKANPALMAAIIKQRTDQRQKELLQQQQQQQMLINEKQIKNQTKRPSQVLRNPNLSTAVIQEFTQIGNKLCETINHQQSAQKPQVLVILKDNPQSSAAFIKQEQLLHQQKEQEILINKVNITGYPKKRPRIMMNNSAHSTADMQRPSQVWKELPETSKSQSVESSIPKANPQLTTAFIKQRTVQKHQYQQHRQMLLNVGTPNRKAVNDPSGREHLAAIEIRRRKFNCHICILGAPSSVFPDTLEHNMEAKTSGTVTTEDSEPNTFEKFLIYLYTGNKKHLSLKNIMDRYHLANKYCVGNQEKLCKDYIKKNLTTENFYDFYLLSDMHNDREIIDIAIQFFLENSKEISESKKWAVFVNENKVESNGLIEALAGK